MNQLLSMKTLRVVMACIIAGILHALLLAPTGDLSNAGFFGSLVLGLAAFYAWFVHERDRERRVGDVLIRLAAIFFLTLAFLHNIICLAARFCQTAQ